MPSGIVIDICSGFINTIWILIDTDIVNTVLFSSTGYFYYFSLYINPWSQKLQFFYTLGSVRCQKRDEEKSADGQKHYSRLVL